MFDEVIQSLWQDLNPYCGFNKRRFRPDTQGWNSHHSYLSDAIKNLRPGIVVEVGVWKGGSAIHMANSAKEDDLPTTIIAVDTFLGSWEHWEQPEHFVSLLFQNGYPSMYYTFLTNVVESNNERRIIPLPLDSVNASIVLSRKGIRPQVIHIDGGHDYDTVTSDLTRWWPLLEPGGMLIADDYDQEGKVWPSVKQAVDAFVRKQPHEAFEMLPYKCRFRKPL